MSVHIRTMLTYSKYFLIELNANITTYRTYLYDSSFIITKCYKMVCSNILQYIQETTI